MNAEHRFLMFLIGLPNDLTGNKGESSLAFCWVLFIDLQISTIRRQSLFSVSVVSIDSQIHAQTYVKTAARRLKGLEGYSANAIEMLQGMILCQET
jgi:hypothetical protein